MTKIIFVEPDGKEVTVQDFTADKPSNSTGLISKDHGEWTYPLWPQINCQGSPPTPYIYDSRASINDIVKGLEHWYNMSAEDRRSKGMAGREWAIKNGFTQKGMCDAMVDSIETCFKNFKPRKAYTLINTTIEPKVYSTGVIL